MGMSFDEKVDNKVLIMLLLDRIGYPVSKDDLSEICCMDLNSDYFSFSDCLCELVDSGHISEKDNLYYITTKGKKNLSTLYDGLPYTTKKKAEKLSAPLKEKLGRQAMICAEHSKKGENISVHLSLSDGKGKLMDLEMLCQSEKAALEIEEKFKKDAENYYLNIMGLFY